MKIVEWEERLVKKVTARNLNLALFGNVLILLTFGSIFAIELVKYGFWILILAGLILIYYTTNNIRDFHAGKKILYGRHMFGSIGLALLVVFLGIQATPIPFKIYIFGLGVLMMFPAVYDMVRGKK